MGYPVFHSIKKEGERMASTIAYKMQYWAKKLAGIGDGSEVLINCIGLTYEWRKGRVVAFSEKGATIKLLEPASVEALELGNLPVTVCCLDGIKELTVRTKQCEGGDTPIIHLNAPIIVDTVELEWIEEKGEGYLPFLQLRKEAVQKV
jgi:hypothetical protein